MNFQSEDLLSAIKKHNGQLPETVPLPLPDEVLTELVPKVKDWALMHGAAMRSKEQFSQDSLHFAPFVLFPTPFPRAEFERAIELQPVLNKLMHAVAHDREFLVNTLMKTIKVDAFTKSLFEIYDKVFMEGFTQPFSLGLLRSDLMLETNCVTPHIKVDVMQRPYCCWKQVEFNTIASGFGWLGPLSRAIQSFVLEELGRSDQLVNLPPNNALTGICSAMLYAHRLYAEPEAVILFLVENVTYNICDQRFHEFEIARLNPTVKVKRRTLTQVATTGRLSNKKELFVETFQVSVVYFRAGYEPAHYMSDAEWNARLMIERSRAIKCPSIQYHLAGTKKVQQELAMPGNLERFLNDSNEVHAVRSIFTGLYSLDGNQSEDGNKRMAMEHPERFVLKPQREGGGNNIYGIEVRDALKEMSPKELSAWILMDRIEPPVSRGYIVRPGGSDVPQIVDMVSELGIFGVIIGNADTILRNEQVGHMLRTKVATANEGGVAAGLGALDSPYLFD